MTYQEILEAIARHRANPINTGTGLVTIPMATEIKRKIDEIEWTLQALCEKLANQERE